MNDSCNPSSAGSTPSTPQPHVRRPTARLGLFEGIGIELEYMIVDHRSLDVLPICDRLLQAEAGELTMSIDFDDIGWSNELALHVAELKTAGPASSLHGLIPAFDKHVRRMNQHLADMDAQLMGSAMHPWMDPFAQLRLWPHEDSPIYHAFNRIFDCRGHGWANLQSTHINLPFADDEQFGRLHAAIRLVLPLIPALAASSPIHDGQVTGLLDSRLEAYRHHCDRVPSLVGQVIPEPVFTSAAYQQQILGRIYDDLKPHDPQGVLRDEWANARGAIARFGRGAIEIRLIDAQECPRADVAVAGAMIALVHALTEDAWCSQADQRAMPTQTLVQILDACIEKADQAVIGDEAFLRAMDWSGGGLCTAGRLWGDLVERLCRIKSQYFPEPIGDSLHIILKEGPLARRLLAAAGEQPDAMRLRDVYAQLCSCLASGVMFRG